LLKKADVEIGGDRPWDITVRNTELYNRVLRSGTLGLGESYMDGWWDAEKLDEMLYLLLKNKMQDQIRITPALIWSYVQARVFNPQKSRAFEVAQKHYDLGNDLFKLYRQVSYDDLKEILLFNLAQYHAAFCKEFGQKGADLIKIEGFEFETSDEEVVEEVVEKPAPAAKPTPKPSAKPMPKFSDDEDDEEDLPAPRATTKTQAAPKPAPKKAADEDLFDMADDLLNS